MLETHAVLPPDADKISLAAVLLFWHFVLTILFVLRVQAQTAIKRMTRGCSLGLERLGLEAVLRVQHLGLERLGLEAVLRVQHLGLECLGLVT